MPVTSRTEDDIHDHELAVARSVSEALLINFDESMPSLELAMTAVLMRARHARGGSAGMSLDQLRKKQHPGMLEEDDGVSVPIERTESIQMDDASKFKTLRGHVRASFKMAPESHASVTAIPLDDSAGEKPSNIKEAVAAGSVTVKAKFGLAKSTSLPFSQRRKLLRK